MSVAAKSCLRPSAETLMGARYGRVVWARPAAKRPRRAQALSEAVYATFGDAGRLMNNAATRVGGGAWGRRGVAIPGCRITAHLLILGWTTTGKNQHRPGAWRPDQVIDVLLAALDRGDFYIICPDDETTLEMARTPIVWSAGDLVENRPALSRWHPDDARGFAQSARDLPARAAPVAARYGFGHLC